MSASSPDEASARQSRAVAQSGTDSVEPRIALAPASGGKLHPGQEIGLVVLVAIAAVVVSLRVAHGMIGLLGVALALVMLAIALIDGRRFVIPDSLSALGLILVSSTRLRWSQTPWFPPWRSPPPGAPRLR